MGNIIDTAEIRKNSTFDPNSFLYETKPISRVFGLDRGTPIDRYYIEKFLDLDRSSYFDTEKHISFLEISESTYSRKMALKFDVSDATYNVLDYRNGDNLTDKNTLKEDAYDVLICTQTFNFIYDVRKAIEGAYYTLKKSWNVTCNRCRSNNADFTL